MIKLGSTKEGTSFYKATDAANPHIAIFGQSGKGKTTLAHNLCAQSNRSLAFHICGSEIMSSEKELGWSIITPSDKLAIPLYNEELDTDKNVQRILDILNKPCKFAEDEKQILSSAIKAAIEQGTLQKEGIAAVLERLSLLKRKAVSALISKVRSSCGGLNIVNEDVSEYAAHTSIVLSELPNSAQISLLTMYLHAICARANVGKYVANPVTIFVDDVQILNGCKKAQEALLELVSTGRRKGITLILATTDIPIGTSNGFLKKFLTQCTLAMYFYPGRSNAYSLASKIDRNNRDELTYTLDGLDKGQFIAVGELVDDNGKKYDTPICLKTDYDQPIAQGEKAV